MNTTQLAYIVYLVAFMAAALFVLKVAFNDANQGRWFSDSFWSVFIGLFGIGLLTVLVVGTHLIALLMPIVPPAIVFGLYVVARLLAAFAKGVRRR